MIYNAAKKSNDGINIAPNTTVTLSAPTTGTYQGVVLFQDRASTAKIAISGGTINLTGIVYAPKAELYFAGNKNVTVRGDANNGISAAIVVAALISSGNGAINVDTSANAPTATPAAHLAGPQLAVAPPQMTVAVTVAPGLQGSAISSNVFSTSSSNHSAATTSLMPLSRDGFFTQEALVDELFSRTSSAANNDILDDLFGSLNGNSL